MTLAKQVYLPDQILIHENVGSLGKTQQILQMFPEVPKRVIASLEEALPSLPPQSDLLEAGKRILFLTRHRGRVLKPCQGICENVSCCLYYVVDFACNCPLDCSYCLLQDYLNTRLIQIYLNTDEMIAEIESELARRRDHFFRVGTGELTDSLALDAVTGLSRQLVPFFALQSNAVLELKTKTKVVEQLEGLDHRGRTVISWSINSPAIIATEEKGSVGLEERLNAARKCAEWGYLIGFHFDPLVLYPQAEKDYLQTVDQVFEAMRGYPIAWISLGALRCTAALLEIIRERFPESSLPLGEMVRGMDGKMRYFRPLRVELFRKMRGWIARHNPRQAVYLCMESPRVWEQVFGYRATPLEVCSLLDHSAALLK